MMMMMMMNNDNNNNIITMLFKNGLSMHNLNDFSRGYKFNEQ